MPWKGRIKRALRRIGIDVQRSAHTFDHVRSDWLRRLDVDAVIDVGANTGQYAGGLRAHGYVGTIVSIEPLTEAFERLQARVEGDSQWRCLNLAVGSYDGEAEFHVSRNLASSSFLDVSIAHVAAEPLAARSTTMTVEVRRLDSLFSPHEVGERILLKLDVQGFERECLQGLGALVDDLVAVECELSLVETYSGQVLADGLIAELEGLGFAPVWMERGLSSESPYRMLQLDGLFVRRTESIGLVAAEDPRRQAGR